MMREVCQQAVSMLLENAVHDDAPLSATSVIRVLNTVHLHLGGRPALLAVPP